MLMMPSAEDVPAGLAQKLELMLRPPQNVRMILKTPPRIRTFKQLSEYMWARYHIAVECEDLGDMRSIGDLYYDADGYSWMGYVESISPNQPILLLCPSGFVGWASDVTETDPGVPYTAEWRRLISDSQVLGPGRSRGAGRDEGNKGFN